MLFLDIETTGLPIQPSRNIYYDYKETKFFNSSRVIQICMQLYDDKKNIEKEIYEYIKTDVKIPEGAIKIHGITDEECDKKGKRITELYQNLYEILYRTKLVIGHNINFDVSVLASELHRNGLENIARLLFYKKRFCTMKQAQNYGIPKYNPRLSELYYMLFNKQNEGAHDAKSDVIACKDCFYKMIEN